MELLTLMLIITKDLFNYLPNFISRIKENIFNSLNKNFNSAYDYITCVKLCRLTYQINLNLEICYDLIQNYIKYAESSSITWQKNLGIESISQILFSPYLLFNLYIYNDHKLYESIFSILNKITYVNVLNLTTKNSKNSEIDYDKIISERYFNNDIIYYEGETNPNPILTNEIIFVEMLLCYLNLFESFKKFSEHDKEEIKEIGDKNINPLNIYDIIHYKQNELLNSILALSQVSNNENILDKFMNIFKNAIIIFGNLNCNDLRDLYLKELDNLIHLPNDDELNKTSDNIFLEEKVMITIFDIFNDNIEKLDEEGFNLLLNSIQKINVKIIKSENNLLIKPNEEFELEVYIKYIEQNLKKYTNFSITEDGKSIIKDNLLNENIKEKIEETNNEEEEEEKEKETEKEENNNNYGYGLFSTLKYVFGFSKKKTNEENEINQHNLLQQKEVLKKLSEKINCLFIENSNEYKDKVLINIMNGLVENTKKLCDIPSDNQIYFLHFNLSRFLEIVIVNYKRINLVYDKFIEIALLISSKLIKNVSHYAIDVLTISIMILLNLIKDENFFPQKDLFSSLITISSKNFSQDISLNIIYDIHELLLNSSKLLNNEGWNSIFEIFKKQILYSDEAQTENCFMLLEEIFKNNFNELTPDNIIYIMDLLEGFIIYKKNENISIMALKMIEYLCNLCEKFSSFIYISNNNFDNSEIKLTDHQKIIFQKKYDSIEKRKKFFDDLWKSIFFKIINLSCDERVIIRQLVIETYQNIFIKRCSLISPETSLYIINSNFFEVFNKTYEIYNDKMKNKRKINKLRKEKKEEERLNSEKKIKFGEYQIDQLKLPQRKQEKKEEENNKDIKEKTEENKWEDTLQFSIKSISFIISSFLQTNPNLGFQFFENQIFIPLSEKFSEAMKFNSPNIIIEILNCILIIEESYSDLFYKYFHLFWSIYYEMSNFISNHFFYENFSDLVIECKMTNKILDNLKKLYLKKEFIEVTLNLDNFKNLLFIIKSLIISVYFTEGNNNNEPPYNLLLDETNIFEFMKEIQKIIINKEDDLISYCQFLSSYLKIDLNNLHSEALCRKSLEMFVYLFSDQNLPFNIYKNYLPIFINNCKDLICLRNKIDYVTSLLEIREKFSKLKKKNSGNYGNSFNNNFSSIIGNNNKELNDQNQINIYPEIPINQLWHFSSEILIKILSLVITNKNLNKNNIENIWECLIESLEIIFKQSEGGYKTIPKNIQDELIKSCQEMEISIINFIVNTLLPNSLYIEKKMQIQLLNLLDMGSNFDYSNQNSSSTNSSLQSSISKVCISNLFELCKFKTENNLKREINEKNINPDDYVKIKVKIAKMCTPILIKRCKETLKKFLDDEIKSGSMPLSRSRLEDIKFVLEKLKVLEVYPDYIYVDEKDLNEKKNKEKDMMDFILLKKKSHLISLLPLLSEFITTKENEIKILVKQIFRIISEELGIK